MAATYYKYAPNVFLAKTEEKLQRGDTIMVTTKYGKDNECIVCNLVADYGKGFYYYSIVRADGFDSRKRALLKAGRYIDWAESADKKSDEYFEKSKKDNAFLSLAEPIKIGHHSEKRHRKIIDQAWNNTGKMVAEMEKAKEHLSKSEYWEGKAEEINLSMPESLEYFQFKLEKAREYHAGLKNGTIERGHSFSLTYANKDVKELEKKVDLALKLWGIQ
jgi:hypothetical protein